MGIYINNRILMEKEKEKKKELDKAQMMLEIADKDVKIQNLIQENAGILMEIALLKGGM